MRLFLRCWVAIIAVWLLAPTLLVIPLGLSSASTFQFPPPGWSLQWYESFFTSSVWLGSLWASIRVALVSAVLALILGVSAALGYRKMSWRGKPLVRGLIMAPMIVPLVVVGIAVYAAFLTWDISGSITGFVVAHTLLGIPFVFVTVSASLENYDETLERASLSLGARPLTTFRRVTLPLILPGVATGFVFALVTSFDEVVVALFLQSPNFRTLPVVMYNAVALDIDPTIAAASTMILVVTTIIILAPEFMSTSRKRVR